MKNKGNKTFDFVIPNGLLLNPIMTKIVSKGIEDKAQVYISSDQLLLLCRSLKKSKETLGNYNLVEIESKNGEIIKIQL